MDTSNLPSGWNSQVNISPWCPSKCIIGANRFDVRLTPCPKEIGQYQKCGYVRDPFHLPLPIEPCLCLCMRPPRAGCASLPAPVPSYRTFVCMPCFLVFSKKDYSTFSDGAATNVSFCLGLFCKSKASSVAVRVYYCGPN